VNTPANVAEIRNIEIKIRTLSFPNTKIFLKQTRSHIIKRYIDAALSRGADFSLALLQHLQLIGPQGTCDGKVILLA